MLPGRLIGLDLLRGMAAYMVFVAHCGPALEWMLGAGALVFTNFLALTGVELFFALSGFLIGGILIDLPPSARNLGVFLARRWMRTLPVYYLALAVYLLFPRIFEQAPPPDDPWRYVVFAQTLLENSRFFGVSWSLAIEEWFYLALPLVLFLRLRYLHAVLLLIAVGISLRFLLPADPRALLGRVDAIAYGCLMAWLARSRWAPHLGRHAWLLLVASVGGMLTVYAWIVLQRMQLSRPGLTLCFTAFPLLAALALPAFSALRIRSVPLARLATFGAAVSYPLYVFHYEVIHALGWTRLHPGTGLLHIAAALLLATGVAYAVHILVERPFIRMRPALRKDVGIHRQRAALDGVEDALRPRLVAGRAERDE